MNYPYIRALYLAFFSRPFYRALAARGRGAGAVYLLFLTAIVWLPQIMNLNDEFAELLDREAPYYVEQMPKITITGGAAAIAEPVPMYIYARDRSTPVGLIDTSERPEGPGTNRPVFEIYRTRMVVRQESGAMREFDFKGIDNLVVDKKMLYEWLELINNVFSVVIYPLAVFFGYLFVLVQALFCAIAGIFIARRFNLAPGMKCLMRLTAAAYTPAAVLQAVHAALKIAFPYSMPLSVVLTLGYLLFAVSALSDEGGQDRPQTGG